MKEGRVQSRYPNLIQALSMEQDTSRQRQLFESHRLRIGSTSGASRMQIEQGRAKASSQWDSCDAAQGGCGQLNKTVMYQ